MIEMVRDRGTVAPLRRDPPAAGPGAPAYAELCVTSNFTFLTGASHPEELVARAAELGLAAIAITDRNSLAGVVRAHSALRELQRAADEALRIRSQHHTDPCSRQEVGHPQDIPRPDLPHPEAPTLPRLIVGCRLVLADCPVEWLALPTDRTAYHRLSRLLTLGKRRAEKGQCHLELRDLVEGCQGMILIALPPAGPPAGPPPDQDAAARAIREIRCRFPGHVFLGAAPRYDGSDQAWLDACAGLALRVSAPMVAVGEVLMHRASRRQLADVLTCLRHHITIDEIGTRALPNAERRLKGAGDMARVFRTHPAALRRTLEIAARCTFSLDELSYEYPDEIADGEAPQARLGRLTREGLVRRCPDGIPARYRALADKELRLVAELGFAAYFLTVHDIVQYARSIGILCQGRGSAANSILCWALGITDVSPEQITMVFERFVSKYRGEPPDIDVDFEHERREEVIQHIYQTYGRHRAGLCATVIHFRSRAAIREVGKVMGLSQDVTAGLSSQIWGHSNGGAEPERVRELGLDPTDRRLAQTIRLIGEIIGFPRHLSQHVGGFVITRGRLDELCPIENAAMEDRTVIEWDKDDIDALGILKVDILGLGMLTCLRKAFDLIEAHEGHRPTLAGIEQEDRATYDMLCRADAIGVFQVESRAQMNFLPRMQPAHLLRSGDRGRHRPPRPDPGRHGPALCQAPAGAGEGRASRRRRWKGCWARRWACRCFRSRRCRSRWSRRGSRPKRPTGCAARSPRSGGWARSAPFATASSRACWPMATRPTSPPAAFPRSRASPTTAFPKAMPPPSPCSPMSRPG